VYKRQEGIDVSEDSLAVDLIEEVGPVPGHFLNKRHTRQWWKHEQNHPHAADKLTYPEWEKVGRKGCMDYAMERFDDILTNYSPPPLTASQEEEIERILEEARDYYQKQGLITSDEMAVYRQGMRSSRYPYE